MLFSVCLFCLLKDHLVQCEQIIIDVEYEGKNADIKAFLLRYIWKIYPKFRADAIVFRRIGKKSPADHKARRVREGRDREFRKITIKELLEILK